MVSPTTRKLLITLSRDEWVKLDDFKEDAQCLWLDDVFSAIVREFFAGDEAEDVVYRDRVASSIRNGRITLG